MAKAKKSRKKILLRKILSHLKAVRATLKSNKVIITTCASIQNVQIEVQQFYKKFQRKINFSYQWIFDPEL